MRISKVVLSFSLMTALSACTLPEPQQKSSTGADFTVDKITGSVGETQLEATFALPKARVYNYSVCVKSLSHARPLTGQEFEIIEAKKTARADAAGCVNWSETLEFDYLSQSVYVPVERTIKALGLSRGSRKVRFAVNPWSHGETKPLAAVDLDRNSVAPLSTQSQPQVRGIWMEDLRLSVTDDRMVAGGLQLVYQLYGAPRLQLTNTEGAKVLELLRRGNFKVNFTLIQQDIVQGREVRVPLATYSIDSAQIQNESLALRVPMLLKNIPKSGNLFIGMELIPVDESGRIKGMQAIYSAGDYRALRTPNFLKVSPLVNADPNFTIAGFLTPPRGANGQSLPIPTPHQQAASIEVEHLRFAVVQRGEESALKKRLIYTVTACVKSGVDHETLMSRPITVTRTRFDESSPIVRSTLTTNHTSCVYWDETLDYDYYACQRFMKGHVVLQNADLGLDKKIEYVINPWEMGGNFAFDLRNIDRTRNVTMTCDPKTQLKAHMDLESYSYSTQSYSYDVDAQLNMLVKKRILLRIDPKVLVYSNLTQGMMDRQPLRDGAYLLRFVITRNKDYDSNNTYVTHIEKLVRVIGGRINEEVDIVSRDLKSMGNRNTLLLELHPVDPSKISTGLNGRLELAAGVNSLNDAVAKNSEIVSNVFMSSILLNEEDGGRAFKMADSGSLMAYLLDRSQPRTSPSEMVTRIIRDGWNKQKTELEKMSRSGLAPQFARDENLVHFDLKKLQGQPQAKAFGVSREDLAASFAASRFNAMSIWNEAKGKTESVDLRPLKALVSGRWSFEAAESLCLYFTYEVLGHRLERGNHSLFVLSCLREVAKNPESFFRVESRRYAHRLRGADFVRGARHGLSVGSSFSLSHSYSENFGTQYSLSGNFGLGGRFFSFITMGVGGSAAVNWGTTDSAQRGNSISVGEDIRLVVSENVMRLNVATSEKCLVVRLNPELFQEKTRTWYLYKPTNYSTYLTETLNDAQRIEAVDRGLFLCSGELDQSPISVLESFYLINQESTGSDVQDKADERNRPFFMALRGASDYNRFVNMLKANPFAPATADADASPLSDVGSFLEQSLSNTKSAPRQIVIPAEKPRFQEM